MLVLSRKPKEVIRIGDNIKVTVLRIGPNSVRLGFDAPGRDIMREELLAGNDQVPDPGRRELEAVA